MADGAWSRLDMDVTLRALLSQHRLCSSPAALPLTCPFPGPPSSPAPPARPRLGVTPSHTQACPAERADTDAPGLAPSKRSHCSCPIASPGTRSLPNSPDSDPLGLCHVPCAVLCPPGCAMSLGLCCVGRPREDGAGAREELAPRPSEPPTAAPGRTCCPLDAAFRRPARRFPGGPR